jgi:hypothetical protein
MYITFCGYPFGQLFEKGIVIHKPTYMPRVRRVIGYGLDNWSLIPGRGKDSFSCHCVQTGSGLTQPGGSFHGVK